MFCLYIHNQTKPRKMSSFFYLPLRNLLFVTISNCYNSILAIHEVFVQGVLFPSLTPAPAENYSQPGLAEFAA